MSTNMIDRYTRKMAGAAQRGSTLMMTLVYCLMFAALASSMVAFSQGNVMVQGADTETKQALMAAESGMSFLMLKTENLSLPIITEGDIGNMGTNGANASLLWTGTNVEGIAGNNGIAVSLASALNASGAWSSNGVSAPSGTGALKASPINLDTGNSPSTFTLTATWNGVKKATLPATYSYVSVLLSSTGQCGKVSRTVTMEIQLQKKLNYAVYSNVAIQLGKNVHVIGDVASTFAGTSKGPPVQSFSDMHFFTNSGNLDSTLGTFRGLLATYDPNHINRIDTSDAAAATAAKNAGLKDVNGDGYIDEWDISLQKFGSKVNPSAADPYGVTKVSFTDPTTGKPYDPDYLTLNDVNGDNTIYYDDNHIPAKVTGNVKMAITYNSWTTAASGWSQWGDITGGTTGKTFTDQFEGTVLSSASKPVQFGVDFSNQQALTPQDFDTSTYDQKIPNAAATTNTTINGVTYNYANGTLSANQANGGTISEHSPASVSSGWQATYQRPVFQNMHFYNVRIPKGLNAKFINCTFDGYTSVQLNPTITKAGTNTTTYDPTEGMKWAQQMTNGTTFSANTALTGSNSVAFSNGNNLHFTGCTFTGPLTSSVPTAYTHFADSWEFDTYTPASGSPKDTIFNNTTDQTVTILAPNTNIEMGGFNNPGANPTTLVGVVVAGNLDVRGTANFDGSIVVTGNGASNTTLGYFGSTDQGQGVPSPSQLPAGANGSYGHLYFKINPNRGMPNGIAIPVVVVPQYTTYQIQ